MFGVDFIYVVKDHEACSIEVLWQVVSDDIYKQNLVQIENLFSSLNYLKGALFLFHYYRYFKSNFSGFIPFMISGLQQL